MSTSTIGKSAIAKLECLPELFDHIHLIDENKNANGNEDQNKRISENIIERVNECFDSMASHWQQGNYLQILELADNLPLYCLCDIRICVYCLYSFWVSEKNHAFARVIIILTNILKHLQQPWLLTNDHKQLRNSKILMNSIGLFFRKSLANIVSASDHYDYSRKDIEHICQALDDFREVAGSGKCNIGHENDGSLRDLMKHFSALKDDIEKNMAEVESIQIIDAFEDPQGEKPKREKKSETGIKKEPSNATLIDPALFNPSYALQLLLRRMLVLQTLIEKQENLKAAIVLADIQSELDDFNPLIYFPEYFANFAGLRARHGGKLEPYFSQHKSYQWQVLSEYYRSDMSAFVALEEAEHTSNESHNFSEKYSENYSESYAEEVEYND
ncbi:MAG: type VI secretion system protein IglI family protein [Pseudomonadota bacterium]